MLAVGFGVDGGAFAFVSHDPALAARRSLGRILFSAPVANNDWPSCLLPGGFRVNISLCAAFRRAEHAV